MCGGISFGCQVKLGVFGILTFCHYSTKCQTKPLYFAFKRSGGRVGGFFCILRRFAKYILLPYVLMLSHNGRKCDRIKP